MGYGTVSRVSCVNLLIKKVSQDSRGHKDSSLWSLLATMTSRSSVLEAVWNSAQPKLAEIQASLAKGRLENHGIIRVGQLDSELLDQELAQLLKEPITKALSLINVCFAQHSSFPTVNPMIHESQISKLALSPNWLY